MQKIFKKPYFPMSFALFFVNVSLSATENLESSLALLGRSLENVTITLQTSKPSTPIVPVTPVVPKKPKVPETPKTPPKKPIIPETPATPKTTQNDIGRLALQYTNEFRAQNGLAPLKWNQKIADLATEHSKNMAEGKVTFGHEGFPERVARYPGRYKSAAENVFMTSSERAVARDAVNGWINSPGHRKNLLSKSSDCGIGAYKGKRGWYVTQLFARF